MISAPDLISVLFAVGAMAIPVPFLFRLYGKFRHAGHLGLAIGNALFVCQAIAGFIIYDTSTDLDILQNVIVAGNLCLVAGFWCVLLAILLAQFDHLPIFSHLVSLIVGMLAVLFLSPSEVHLELNPPRLSYTPAISILEAGLVAVFLIFAYVPLVKKMHRTKHILKEKHYLVLLLGYTVITAWALLLGFAQFEWVGIFRRYLLPIGLLLWNWALIYDPLTIIITQSRMQKLIVLTKTGLPLFSYDLEHDKPLDTDLIAGLLTAIKSSVEEVMTSSKSALKSINFENSNLSVINGQKALLLILGRQALSSNFRLIANHFLRKFERRYEQELARNFINAADFSNMQVMVRNVTDKVLF